MTINVCVGFVQTSIPYPSKCEALKDLAHRKNVQKDDPISGPLKSPSGLLLILFIVPQIPLSGLPQCQPASRENVLHLHCGTREAFQPSNRYFAPNYK